MLRTGGAPSASTYGQSQLPNHNVSSGGAPCPQHPDELVSYYCFSCHCPPICAECVIHGEHHGHEVQTIRRAHPQLLQEFETLLHVASQKGEDLHLQENKLEAKKRDLADQTRNLKLQVASHFEDLRQRLDQREREMQQKIDDLGLRGQADVERCVRLVKSRSQNLRENENTISTQLQAADEVQLISFYAERFRMLSEQIEAEADILPEIQEADHTTEIRQAGALDAMHGFQADMDIIMQNLQMLEFDVPQGGQPPAHAGSGQRPLGATAKSHQISPALASAAHSQGRATTEDGQPPSHPSHQGSVQAHGRRGLVPPPMYPHKLPSRSGTFTHHTSGHHT